MRKSAAVALAVILGVNGLISSAARAVEEVTPVNLHVMPGATNTDATYCSTADETLLAHSDGGVLKFGKICLTIHENADGQLLMSLGAKILDMNHHTSVDWYLGEFFMKTSPDTQLRTVEIGGDLVRCRATPADYQKTFSVDNHLHNPPLLLNAAPNAQLNIQWHTGDDTQC